MISAGTYAARLTFSPTPTTTLVVAPVERPSVRIPAHLIPSSSKSFGHFSASVTPHTRDTASATAKDDQNPTAGSDGALISTGKIVEKSSPDPAGDDQCLTARPRPAP